jgi:hypothetical protein
MDMRFHVGNNTESMRITTTGNVGIGTISPISKLQISENNSNDNTTNGITVEQSGTGAVVMQYLRTGVKRWVTGLNSSNNFAISENLSVGTDQRIVIQSGGNVGIGTTSPSSKLHVIGDITSSGDVIAFSSSDRQLKDNIIKINSPLEKLSKIGGYTFNWNNNQDTYTGKDYGVIAQEIEEIFPELVTTRENGYKAVKYEKIIPLLIEAIKELSNKIKILEEK